MELSVEQEIILNLEKRILILEQEIREIKTRTYPVSEIYDTSSRNSQAVFGSHDVFYSALSNVPTWHDKKSTHHSISERTGTAFRQKIAIVLVGLFGIFGAILALIIVLLIFVSFLLLLASPFIIAGVIGAYLAGVWSKWHPVDRETVCFLAE